MSDQHPVERSGVSAGTVSGGVLAAIGLGAVAYWLTSRVAQPSIDDRTRLRLLPLGKGAER